MINHMMAPLMQSQSVVQATGLFLATSTMVSIKLMMEPRGNIATTTGLATSIQSTGNNACANPPSE